MWQTDMVEMVRFLIGDVGATLYVDSHLQRATIVAAKYVNSEVFANSYTVDIPSTGISPDPTTNGDEAFVNLTVLKTACLLGLGEAKVAAGQGIAIRDGSSMLDLKGVSSSKQIMSKSFCDMYEQAKFEYLMNGDENGPPGKAIMTPIKQYRNNERGLYA